MLIKILSLALVLVTPSSFAVNKCIVDGKTVYQQSPCINGSSAKFEGAVSAVDSGGLRQQMENEAVVRRAQEIEQLKKDAELRPTSSTDLSEYDAINQKRAAARQKLYEMGLRSKTDDKLDDISKRLNSIERQQRLDSNQQAWRELQRR